MWPDGVAVLMMTFKALCFLAGSKLITGTHVKIDNSIKHRLILSKKLLNFGI